MHLAWSHQNANVLYLVGSPMAFLHGCRESVPITTLQALQIKLTPDRLTGEKGMSYAYGDLTE